MDRFVYCNCERLCPEAPVPVLDIIETKDNPGMAGNVIVNVSSLNKECEFSINVNWRSVTKTRYVEAKTNHMFVRIDHTEKIEPFTEFESYKNKQFDAVLFPIIARDISPKRRLNGLGKPSRLPS